MRRLTITKADELVVTERMYLPFTQDIRAYRLKADEINARRELVTSKRVFGFQKRYSHIE